MGKILINGTEITIVHTDETKESFETLRQRAYDKVPEALKGEMSRMEPSPKTGNVVIAFGPEYYPGKGNMSNAEYSVLASRTRAQKLVISASIVTELLEAGVPHDHFTVKDTWFKKDFDSQGKPIIENGREKGSYQPTTQIWLNKERLIHRAAAAAGPSRKELDVQYIETYENTLEGAKALMKMKAIFAGDLDTGYAAIQAHINKAGITAAVTTATVTKPEVPASDDMPDS